MKKTLVLLLLVVVATSIAAPAFAADPDFWAVDTSRQNIGPQDVWAVDGDGITDEYGMMRFGDWSMLAHWLFGPAFRWHW